MNPLSLLLRMHQSLNIRMLKPPNEGNRLQLYLSGVLPSFIYSVSFNMQITSLLYRYSSNVELTFHCQLSTSFDMVKLLKLRPYESCLSCLQLLWHCVNMCDVSLCSTLAYILQIYVLSEPFFPLLFRIYFQTFSTCGSGGIPGRAVWDLTSSL